MIFISEMLEDENKEPVKPNFDEEQELVCALEWEKLKDYVFPYFVPGEYGESYLEQYVGQKVQDMFLIYELHFAHEDGGVMHCQIQPEMLEAMGISLEELHQTALDNLSHHTFSILNMADDIGYKVQSEKGELPILVLTNKARRQGSSVILDQKFMDSICGLLEDEFYLIAACSHEWIAVKKQRNGYVPSLEQMREITDIVKAGNVPHAIELSKNIFEYDKATHSLIISKDYEQVA